jgi:hypothetical protein
MAIIEGCTGLVVAGRLVADVEVATAAAFDGEAFL